MSSFGKLETHPIIRSLPLRSQFHRMVRELFVMAREHAPSIIFMDEIDSIGSSRGEGGGGGGDSEVQRTMLELLNQLDGFEGTKNIKVSLCDFSSCFSKKATMDICLLFQNCFEN